MSRQQRKESKLMNDNSTSCLIANLLVLKCASFTSLSFGKKISNKAIGNKHLRDVNSCLPQLGVDQESHRLLRHQKGTRQDHWHEG